MDSDPLAGLTGQSPLDAAGQPRFPYVVVEGPVGVGKTALAEALARRWGVPFYAEDGGATPAAAAWLPGMGDAAATMSHPSTFLREGVSDGPMAAQLAYLLYRDERSKAIGLSEHGGVPGESALITDFLPEKGAVFAPLNLSVPALELYRQLEARLSTATRAPDLVIFLQASVETLFDRIQRRAHPFEWQHSESYLRAMNEAYDSFFYHYERAPVLSVNTDNLALPDDAGDLDLLLAQIETMKGRRVSFVKG